MTRAQQTETAGGAKAVRPGDGIIKRLAYSRRGVPVLTVAFPSGGPDLKLGVIFHAAPVRILIAEQADQLVALLREFVHAAAGPPDLLKRANALLDAIEGRPS